MIKSANIKTIIKYVGADVFSQPLDNQLECNTGIADYIPVPDDTVLVSRSDLIVRAKALGIEPVFDRHEVEGLQNKTVLYTMQHLEIIDTLKGSSIDSVIAVANSVGFCLEEGKEFYIFLAETEVKETGYNDHPMQVDFPAEYTYVGGGPQAVFEVSGDRILSRAPYFPIGARYEGFSESEFRQAIVNLVQKERDANTP